MIFKKPLKLYVQHRYVQPSWNVDLMAKEYIFLASFRYKYVFSVKLTVTPFDFEAKFNIYKKTLKIVYNIKISNNICLTTMKCRFFYHLSQQTGIFR
jgi:hypothetical protein